MKIVLANLKPDLSKRAEKPSIKQLFPTLHFPSGLGIIAHVLKDNGFQFTVIDTYIESTTEEFFSSIEVQKPDIILISAYLGNYTYPFLLDVVRRVKSIHNRCLIVIGGPITAAIPNLLMDKTPVDILVRGEGEITIIELLKRLSSGSYDPSRLEFLHDLKGIYIRNDEGTFFTGHRDRIAVLDNSPFPLYEAFPIESYVNYLKRTNRCWDISASRGCPHNCRFCKLTFGKKVTRKATRSVIAHMKYIADQYGIHKFNFVDDNFLNSRQIIEETVSILHSEDIKDLKWRFQGRADMISPAQVEQMAAVGLYDISFGIESGSQIMLNRYGKRLNISRALENLKEIQTIVDIHCSFIVGGPEETWDDIKKTEKFVRRLKLRNVNIGFLTLFPETDLYIAAKRDGYIADEHEYVMRLGPAYAWPYTNISSLKDDELLEARNLLRSTAEEFSVQQ